MLIDFFKDDNGRIHGARIGGVIYVVALLRLSPWPLTAQFAERWVFAAGWWLTFCDKRAAKGFRELLATPRHVIGTLSMLGGLAAQFYLPLK
jgi:hypothetical protein